MEDSSYVIVLSCEHEDHLLDLADLCHWHEHPYSVFNEPDLEDDPRGWHTALAVLPNDHSSKQLQRVLAALPLQGRG